MRKLERYLSTRPDGTSTSMSRDRTHTNDRAWHDTDADADFPTLTFDPVPTGRAFDTFDIFIHRRPVPLETGLTDYDGARYHAALFSGRFRGAIIFIYYGGVYYYGEPGRRPKPLAAFRYGQQIHCPIRLTPAGDGALRRMMTPHGEPITVRGVGDV